MESSYTIFQVKGEWMGLVASKKGIQRIYLPGLRKEKLKKRITNEFPAAAEKQDFFKQFKNQFLDYFAGERVQFKIPLDLSQATPFQKKVYKIMSKIPYGEVRSYGWLAKKIGHPRALRAVGGANAKNRWPLVIPCHRIVAGNGRLTGFSAPGGLNLKAHLLKLEGILLEQGKVHFFPTAAK